jgi:hypothetical protein
MVLFVAFLVSVTPAWPWGNDGHRIVARIAAMNLSKNARQGVAQILQVSSTRNAVAGAMAEAAIWPDMVLKELDPETKTWHFLDLCRSDDRNSTDRRCSRGGCVTLKVEEYRNRLQDRKYDKWGSKGDLSLLIHFLGDIHQPLHCANNADRGGNCVPIESNSAVDLHGFWDNEVVAEIETQLETGAEGVALKLNQDRQRVAGRFSWKAESANDIAWESHELAENEIYVRLSIPKLGCLTALESCEASPAAIRRLNVRMDSAYRTEAASIARVQLTKGGIRLAELLNAIWP